MNATEVQAILAALDALPGRIAAALTAIGEAPLPGPASKAKRRIPKATPADMRLAQALIPQLVPVARPGITFGVDEVLDECRSAPLLKALIDRHCGTDAKRRAASLGRRLRRLAELKLAAGGHLLVLDRKVGNSRRWALRAVDGGT